MWKFLDPRKNESNKACIIINHMPSHPKAQQNHREVEQTHQNMHEMMTIVHVSTYDPKKGSSLRKTMLHIISHQSMCEKHPWEIQNYNNEPVTLLIPCQIIPSECETKGKKGEKYQTFSNMMMSTKSICQCNLNISKFSRVFHQGRYVSPCTICL